MRNLALAAMLVAVFFLATGGCSLTVHSRHQGPSRATVKVWSDPVVYPPPHVVHTTVPIQAGHLWINGYWEWRVNRWHWHNGYFKAVSPGHIWIQGYKRKVGGRWIWTPGSWKISVSTGGGRAGHRSKKNPKHPTPVPPPPKSIKVKKFSK